MILLTMKTVTPSSSSNTNIINTAKQSIFPSISTATKLCITGTTLGPFIDSLHNQCLLTYNVLPITIDLPATISSSSSSLSSSLYYEPHLFASSWIVPPLLGVAYVVLGGIIPRMIRFLLNIITSATATTTTKAPSSFILGCKAILAIASTAAIIMFSQYLILNPTSSSSIFESSEPYEQHYILLLTIAITQWAYLDGSIVSLVTAVLASILGPFCELPFIAQHCWTYLPDANDVFIPFQNIDTGTTTTATSTTVVNEILQTLLGTEYKTLALNGITGPCYFAVTMDAIAIGKFFDSLPSNQSSSSSMTRRSNTSRSNNDNDIPGNRLFIAKSSTSLQPQQLVENDPTNNEIEG